MVLQLKRCTDLGIIMKKLKLPWPHVADAILKLDPVCLASGEDVQTLEKCLPTDDERKDFQVGWERSHVLGGINGRSSFCRLGGPASQGGWVGLSTRQQAISCCMGCVDTGQCCIAIGGMAALYICCKHASSWLCPVMCSQSRGQMQVQHFSVACPMKEMQYVFLHTHVFLEKIGNSVVMAAPKWTSSVLNLPINQELIEVTMCCSKSDGMAFA